MPVADDLLRHCELTDTSYADKAARAPLTLLLVGIAIAEADIIFPRPCATAGGKAFSRVRVGILFAQSLKCLNW